SHAAFSIIGRLAGGAHYPLGSTQHLVNQLEKKVHKSGGSVAYHTPVKAIVVEDGHSKGVELFNGRTIRSNAIIYDGSLPELFGKLISPEALSEKTRAWVKSLKPTLSATSLYFGIPKSSLPDDIHTNTVLVEDPEKHPWKFISMSIPTILDPSLATDGYHSVFVQAVMENLSQVPWSSMNPEELAEAEESERERIFSSLNRFFPEIEKDAVDIGILPPSSLGGCLGAQHDSTGAQTVGNFPLSSDEIKNLFLAGDSAHPGSGVAQEVASGIKCANATSRLLQGKTIHMHPRGNYVIETVPVRPQVSSSQIIDMLSAVAEAERCIECEDAPCTLGCPAHVDIPTFIRQLKSANGVGAALTIKEAVCLGGSNALVCPSGKLCEARCKRKEIDRAIRIRDLEAVACLQQPPADISERKKLHKVVTPTIEKQKVAVVGAGPAGISCAHFLAKMSYRVEVFESRDRAGGLPRGMMPSWLLDEQVLIREAEEALSDIPVHYNTTFGKDITFDSLLEHGFEAIFLAIGLPVGAMGNTKEVDIPGVIDALSFLAAAKGKVKRELSPKTCVVGDGNIALDTARVARELGAKSVYLLSRKKRLGADPARIEKAKKMGINILVGKEIEEIVGQGRVEGVVLHTKTRGKPNGEPNRERLEAGTIIFADGRGLDKSLQDYISCHLELNRDGSIKVQEETLETSRPGVFAGGDVRGKQNLFVRACADGRKGAFSIDKYLQSSQTAKVQTALGCLSTE
ncbi:MAG: FAD-dependent oxidoreductase, partial [Actinomycetota bacterium]|nr:FAD-dependent oxidoreductase [Actinomycetota bacterium]